MTTLLGRIQDTARLLPSAERVPAGAPVATPPAPLPARALPRAVVDSFGPAFGARLPLPGRLEGEGSMSITGGLFGDLFKKLPFQPGERSTRRALNEMDTLLRGEEISGTSEGGAVVFRDGEDVDSWWDTHPQSARYQEASKQLAANRELEQKRLEELPLQHRDAYLRIKNQLMGPPEGDPVAALALQKLLLKDKLPGEVDLKGGSTLIDGLAQLTQAPLAEGIDRQKLLADLVQELATPETISQGDKGTCTVTSICIQLARRNPAEYVRLVTGLASPEGAVETAGGKWLRREADALTDTSPRSSVQKLLAPALMEIANPRLDYRNGPEDGHYRGDKHRHTGLGRKEVDRVLEAVFDDRFRSRYVGFPAMSRKNAWEKIVEETSQGRDVPVGMEWGKGSGHQVLVTGTEQIDGKAYVRYINPWGQEERLSKDEFLDRLDTIHYEK